MFKSGDKVKLDPSFPFLYGIDSITDLDKNKTYTIRDVSGDFVDLFEISQHYKYNITLYPRYNPDIFKLDIRTMRKQKINKLCSNQATK